jgi:hypothetical protein
VSWRPQFDVWFWALVVWSLIVPYLFDAAHIDTCRETGRVTFIPVWSLIGDYNETFVCTAIPSEHISK